MTLPFHYSLRNLAVRRTTTVLTALALGLSIAVLAAVLALRSGMDHALNRTADPTHIIMLRQGADSEAMSTLDLPVYQRVRVLEGIRLMSDGRPAVSPELVSVANLPVPGQQQGANVTVRGLLDVGVRLRPAVHLTSGRWFRPGQHEFVLGSSLAGQLRVATGDVIAYGHSKWQITGIMEGAGSAYDTEAWVDLNQLADELERHDTLNSILVGTASPADARKLVASINGKSDMGATARSEVEYYNRQALSAIPIQAAGSFVAIIMAVGSAFAAMGTMFAAVARRRREIAILRVLGYSGAAILSSFVLESILLAMIGLAAGLLLVLPLHWVETGLTGMFTFSTIRFRFYFPPSLFVDALLFAIFMGVAGGLLPAIGAARQPVLQSLRKS